MSASVYKKIEIVGTSRASIEEAIETAIKRASTTVKNLRWFEVVETRGRIEKDGSVEYQVTIRIGFGLEE